MVTRRALLRHGAYATLSAAAVSVLGRPARAQSAGSFDFYISPTGSDSNPGTQERPWAITAINTRRGDYAGKRVGLLDGIYNVYALSIAGPPTGASVALAVNGGPHPDSPTVIGSVNARKAILTAVDPVTSALPRRGAPIIGQGYLQVPNKGNVILDGLYLTHAFGAAIFFYPLVLPNPEGGATGIVIRNCEINDVGGIVANNVGGIKLRSCTGALISNNTIHSVQPSPGAANAANASAIFTFNCHSNIYEYNTIFDCNAGIHDKNNHNGNHTYRNNYIEIAGTYPVAALFDCSGGDAGDVVTAHNNILIARVAWDGSDMVMPSAQSLVFYNNTCVGGGIFYPAAGPQASPPAKVTFYNNIVSTVHFCSGTVELSNYNLYASAAPGFALSAASAPRGPLTKYTLSEWQKATGQDHNSITSAIAQKGQFASAASLNAVSYQLQSSSVGRNLGRVGGSASGAVTDVGAWGGGATRVGSDFGPAPRSPVLSIG